MADDAAGRGSSGLRITGSSNLKPGGFKFAARIINYPDGKPGDVGLFFSWPKSALEKLEPADGTAAVRWEMTMSATKKAKKIEPDADRGCARTAS